MSLKHLKISIYDICAFFLIVFAVALRLILIGQGWPNTNSDEGTIGLMALHIAYRGEHPIFFYGQGYMGPLEAYFPALLFPLFGATLFTVRLSAVLILGLFFISMYFLTSLLYTRKLALVTLSLLSLGSEGIFFVQLRAIGGYAETLLISALLLLLASYLALSFRTTMSRRRRWLRFALYACWGYLVGFGMYTDLLIMPFVLMSAILLFLFCWPDLATWAPTYTIASFTLGLLPLLIYNILAPPQQSTLFYFLRTYRSDTTGQALLNHIPLINKLVGALLVGLPNLTGANPICSTETLPLFGLLSPQSISCTLLQGSWTAGCIVLWLIAVLTIVKALWKRRALTKHGFNLAYSEERQNTIRSVARLALLASAALTLLLFAFSPVAALNPWTNSRYLFCLLTATPAIIAPLWRERSSLYLANWFAKKQTAHNPPEPEQVQEHTSLRAKGEGTTLHQEDRPQFAAPAKDSTHRASLFRGVLDEVLRVGVLLYICLMLVLGVIRTFDLVPATQAANEKQDALITKLERIGATRIYSEYWTCNRIMFMSNERIICSVVSDNLWPGYNRYEPYFFIVDRVAAHASYVLPLGSPADTNFRHWVAHSRKRYHHFVFTAYDIYQPV